MAISLVTTLDSTALEGYILKADKIACEVETVTGGLVTERVKTTLAAKLDDLTTLINSKADTSAINTAVQGLLQAITDTNKLDASLIKYTPTGGTETTVAAYLASLNTGNSGESGETTTVLDASNINYTASDGTVKKVNIVLDTILSELGAVGDIGTPAVAATYYTDVDSYNAAKGTSLTSAEFNSLTDSLKLKTEAVEATGLYKLRDDSQASATTATNQATLAQAAANSAATLLQAIPTEKTKALNEIDEKKNSYLTALNTASDKIDSLDEIASKFEAAFTPSDGDTIKYAVVSELAYSSAHKDESIDSNIIYFCYDGSTDDYNYLTITIANSDSTLGYVVGEGVYRIGLDVTLTATVKDLDNSKFVGWYLGDTLKSTDTQYTFTAEEPEDDNYSVEYTAKFDKKTTTYVVMITSANTDTGTVSVSPEGSGSDKSTYDSGASITATATPKTHYKFKNWTNNLNTTKDTTNPKGISVIKNISYIANFEELSKYTIGVVATTGGTVTMDDESVTSKTIYSDDSVVLKAVALDGYDFVNWTNNVNSDSISDTTITVNNPTADKTYTANFKALTVSVTGVTLDKTEVTLSIGNSETLTATVSPETATDSSVTWNTSNSEIVTVTDGVVNAVSAGSATITVTTTDGSKTATCEITVNE